MPAIAAVRAAVKLPLAVKLSPFYSALSHFAGQVVEAGANVLVLVNRFYQPDINVDSMRLQPSLHPSTSAEALLAMRWIAILYGRTSLSLGATGGVHTPEDAIKLLLAGADKVSFNSAAVADPDRPVVDLLGGRVRDRVPFSAYLFYKMEGAGGELGFEIDPDATGWAAARLAEMTPEGHEAIIHVTLTDDHPWAQAFVIIEAHPIAAA